MKRTYQLLSILVLVGGILIGYQNTGVLNNTTSSSLRFWQNYNPQNFSEMVFGPSMLAQDGRTIFSENRKGMWQTLSRSGLNHLVLNSLYLDNSGIFVNSEHAQKIALNGDQLKDLKTLQRIFNIKVYLTVGNSLGKVCRFDSPRSIAAEAIKLDLRLIERLTNEGIIIHGLNFDGPFLRLLVGSRKEFSCHRENLGKSRSTTVSAVVTYMNDLQNEVAKRQNNFSPKLNLVLNLPNWRYNKYMEIAWGQWKNQPQDLELVLNEFKQNLNSPELHSIVLDYPHNYVVGHSHRMLDANSSMNSSLCGEQTRCRRIGAEEAFLGKLELLSTQMNDMKGRPLLGVILNTSGKGFNACIKYGRQAPFVLPFENNKCMDQRYPLARESSVAALADQDRRDQAYIQDTLRFYNMIKYGLPRHIKIDSIYIESWHENPRLMTSYAHHASEIVKK